jgi:hypothetical protein
MLQTSVPRLSSPHRQGMLKAGKELYHGDIQGVEFSLFRLFIKVCLVISPSS